MDGHEGDSLDYAIGLILLLCIIIVFYITRLPGRFPVAIIDTEQNLQKSLAQPMRISRCTNPFSISILNQDIASMESMDFLRMILNLSNLSIIV